MHECDVVVVNYNAGELLCECVGSALREGARKVIVVDNGSQDASTEHLERQFAGNCVTIIRNGRNLGFAAACNLGTQASDAPTLLFLNPDSILSTGALSRMLVVLNDESCTGMVGGLLCNSDGSEQPGGRRAFPTPKRALMRACGLARLVRRFPSIFSDYLLDHEPLQVAPISVDAISGACMLTKRAAIDDVGHWDEGYFLHCEDLDLCMRFRLKRWTVLFVPDARVTHVGGVCSASRPFFVEWHKHKGMLRFYKKFLRQHYPRVLWPLIVVGVWLRLALISTLRASRLAKARLGARQG